MRSFVALAALVALPAAASTWEIDPNHTESSFVVKHLMVSNVRGQFGKTTGTIVQDDKDITKSKAEITIDATTVDTRVAKRDTHLKSADFFDVEKFPTITVDVSSAGLTDPDTIALHVQLTVRAIPRMLDLLVKVTTLPDGAVRLTTTTSLNRKDFGVDGNLLGMMGDTTTVEATAVFVKQS
ncbi:MAG: YceI family protein [Myxococcaceae bacterium]